MSITQCMAVAPCGAWSEMDWSEVDWSEMDWSEMHWSEMDWSEIDWSRLTSLPDVCCPLEAASRPAVVSVHVALQITPHSEHRETH